MLQQGVRVIEATEEIKELLPVSKGDSII